MDKLISAVICSYNRCDLLKSAIESLLVQNLDKNQYEIVVIDNASTDTTKSMIHQMIDSYKNHTIRYLYEEKQGLGYARNLAMRVLNSKYIAYLDDDAVAPKFWLSQALLDFKTADKVLSVGGPYKPYYIASKPYWYKDEYEIRSWGNKLRKLEQSEALSGSNMIWEREALISIEGFGENVGVKGDLLSVGEETIAYQRLWEIFIKPIIIYDPKLYILHYVPENKMKPSYYLRRAFATGQAQAKIERRKRGKIILVLRGILFIGFRFFTVLFHFPKYKYWQNWIVEEVQPIFTKFGYMLANFGIFISIRQHHSQG